MLGLDFSQDEVTAIKAEYCKGATEEQVTLFLAECKRRNLVPGTHLFFQLRSVNEWNADLETKVRSKRATWITKIDAMRLVAQRTGQYQGQEPVQYIYLDEGKKPSVVSDIPLPHPTIPNTPLEPWAARVSVFRTGFLKPFTATCRFDAYAVTRKSGNGVALTEMWVRRGPEQLAKCTEVAALKGAFPEELGSLYITEEFEKEQAAVEPEKPAVVVEAPTAPEVPTINHTPAVPTNEPRPGEVSVPIATPTLSNDIFPVVVTQPELPLPTKRGRKAKPSPEDLPVAPQNPEFQATDDDLPAIMFEDDKPKPAPMTEQELAAKVRSYKVSTDSIKQYILRTNKVESPKHLTPEAWTTVFANMDAAVVSGTLPQLLSGESNATV